MKQFSFRKSLLTFLVAACVLMASGVVLAEEVILLHTNDIHARLESFKSGDTQVGGLGRLASVVEEIRANNPGMTVLVDGGDAIHGTNVANVFGGASMVEAMNAMGYRISTLGNHEFNYGQDVLKQRISERDYPVLASNVIDTKTNAPFAYTSAILTINGVKVGFLGLVAQDTPIVTHPKNVEGLLFLEPIAKASEIVPRLKSQADIVVAVNHIGLDLDKELALRVPGIDVIISAHSHSQLDEPIVVGDTIIASAGEHSKYLGYLKLVVNGNYVESYDGRLIPITAENPVEPKVGAIVDKWNKQLANKLDQVVGTTAVALDGERADVRTRETNLGNLVADVMRTYVGADVAITNGGGIRASIDAGEITMAEVYTVLPFDNTLLSLEVTGAQLLESLEHGVENAPASAGSFLQVSGLDFTYDPAKPAGQRIVDVNIDGRPLDVDGVYWLATNDFMAAGGDGYAALKDARRLVDTGEMLRDILASALGGGTINPTVEGRIKVAGSSK